MKEVALSEVKDDLSKYLRLAETEEIVITRHGKPAGVLVGFASEDDWLDYRLEHDPRFLRRIERARQSMREGNGVGRRRQRQAIAAWSTFAENRLVLLVRTVLGGLWEDDDISNSLRTSYTVLAGLSVAEFSFRLPAETP